MGYLSDDYRPELHYMRGPGPKWLEKHARQSGATAIEDGRKTPTLIRAIQLRVRRWFPTRWRMSRRAAHEPRWNASDRLGLWLV
jgi:hypothetical protein